MSLGPYKVGVFKETLCLSWTDETGVTWPVAHFFLGPEQELGQAQARLFAAAPNLLAACQDAAARCVDCDGEGSVEELFPPHGRRECKRCKMAREAIALAAKGGE